MYRLRDFGSFFVGGRTVAVDGQPIRSLQLTSEVAIDYDPNGKFLIEQLYVQYFIPEAVRSKLPVILLHGGGMTGACWETTPDGRPGWINHLIEAGFPVYVIDMVERGRSGFCAVPGVWTDDPIVRTAREAWGLFRFGRPEDFDAGVPFPGQQFPLHAMAAFQRQFVPRWLSTFEAQVAGVQAAIEQIGPCILICHSQGGHVGTTAAVRSKGIVRQCVGLEPSGFPDAEEITRNSVAGTEWCFLIGDFIEHSSTWTAVTVAMRKTISRLEKMGATTSMIRLPDEGFPGTTHMMMMDAHSGAIADWLSARLLDRQADLKGANDA